MCRRVIFGIHSRHSFLKFQASTPYQKLELPESRVRSAISTLNHGCILPIPSLQLQKKPVKGREAEGLVAELWSPRFATIQWLCCQLSYVTDVNQRRIVEIEILATVSWTCGCQPFSCPCSQNVIHCRKEMCWSSLFKESILAIPFWNFNHPTYQKLEVPESRSTFRHLCIKSRLHHAHPFVAAAEKDCVMQRSRGFGHGVVVPRIVIQYTDCALICAMDFSNSELDVWLPAFQLPMFAKCGVLPKEDVLDVFV